MNRRKNTKAECDKKTVAGKEQESVVWKHGKYPDEVEAAVETSEGSCTMMVNGFEQDVLYRI